MIERDITHRLAQNTSSYVEILLGPRQCGKSTLYSHICKNVTKQPSREITLDDLQLRQRANQDPALFLEQYSFPLIIDEAQYAPNLFPQIKLIVDYFKRQALLENQDAPQLPIIRLTGSNQILMGRNITESLSGRASYYYLNTLTVHEILAALPETKIIDILYKGGFPELYTTAKLNVVQYLNDYLHSYIEKDIVMASGIKKQLEFNTVLSMLAMRSGTFIDYTHIAKDSGIRSGTVKEWTSILESNQLIYLLKPFHNNLNKRLIKRPKLYFLDTGLATRLQGWSDSTALLTSPQAGLLFESLVLAELVKFIENYGKNWKLFVWHTKEQQEIDFIIQINPDHVIALDAKMAIHAVQPTLLPNSFKKDFPQVNTLHLVTLGEHATKLSKTCNTIPISQLHDFLKTL